MSKKFDADGKLVKYKARLVAQGFTQRAGVDYNSTYAPVTAAPSLCLMLSIAANKGYVVDALDISTAFLNGDIDGEVYVKKIPVSWTRIILTRSGSCVIHCMAFDRAHARGTLPSMTFFFSKILFAATTSPVSTFAGTPPLVRRPWLLSTLMT